MSQGVHNTIATGHYWHGNTTFNFISQRKKKGNCILTSPFSKILSYSNITPKYCVLESRQMHKCTTSHRNQRLHDYAEALLNLRRGGQLGNKTLVENMKQTLLKRSSRLYIKNADATVTCVQLKCYKGWVHMVLAELSTKHVEENSHSAKHVLTVSIINLTLLQ